MALLPDRHPQRDFFILDISDVVPKDDTASMEHPLFSLATKPDMRHLVYKGRETSLEMAVLHQSPDKRGVPLPVKMVSQLTQTWHSQVRSFC